MSDLEKVLSDARQAREQAEEAARRAAELEGLAEQARVRAEQERQVRRREWAQRLIASYEADISAAEAAIHTAERRFNDVAQEDVSRAVEAYIAWGEATMRHYAIQLRIAAAAPVLDMDATAAEFAAPPLFSNALDAALAQRLGERADAARLEIEAEIERAQQSSAG